MIYPYALIGLIAAIMGLSGYVPYYYEVLRGRTKPHAFSWLVWGLLLSVGFFAASAKGGGPGTWSLGAPAVLELSLFVIALFIGEKEIARIDIASLIAAIFGIILWILTTNPLWAVIIASVTDTVGYVPTVRKALSKPGEESISVYAFSCVSFLLSLFALRSLNMTTALYPTVLFLSNGIFVLMVLIRRRQLSQNGGKDGGKKKGAEKRTPKA